VVQWAEKAKNGQAQWSDRAETAQNRHPVDIIFLMHKFREFFLAIIVYYPKEVLLPNGNRNSCSNEKLFYQNFEIIECNY
jgi:hypothetical protein